MQVWKPLLIIIPAGLVLGAYGGELANPVVQLRGGDEPWRQMFQPQIEPGHSGIMIEAPPQDPYVGGYSYAPSFAELEPVEWPEPQVDYDYGWAGHPDMPLPTMEELDARLAANTVEPAPPITHSRRPLDVRRTDAGADPAGADQAQEPLPGEPRAANGALPAIW